MEQQKIHIADFDISPVALSRFKLDGGSMFGVVPKPLWERSMPADAQNRIAMSARGMLIRSGSRCFLVDTGIGDKLNDKLNQIYAVETGNFPFVRALAGQGVAADDVTDVILTHLHFDHTGGSTRIDEDGRVVPTFANATYWVQSEQYEWALALNERDRASFMPENFVPLKERGCLELITGEQEIVPGLSVIPVFGHTFAQQLVKVGDGPDSLLFCADLFPTVAHLPYPFIMGYDLQPLITLEEKKRFLPLIHAEQWLLFFEHDPRVILARVEKTKKGFQVGEVLREDHGQ